MQTSSNTFMCWDRSSSDQRPFVHCPWQTAPHPVLDTSVVIQRVASGGVIELPLTESMFDTHHLSSLREL